MNAHLASYALAPSAASMNLSDSAGDDPPHQYTDTKLASLSRAIFNARRNARSVSQTLTLGHAPHLFTKHDVSLPNCPYTYGNTKVKDNLPHQL